MNMDNKDTSFVEGEDVILHAQGFNEPIEGKIVDIATTGEDIILVVRKKDGTQVEVFVKFISGRSFPKKVAA